MGNKFWSVLFGVVMAACFIGFAISPWMGWWMPEGISTHAAEVDFLFYVILYITAFFFVLTEALIVLFMWSYAGSSDVKHPVSETAEFPGFLKPLTGILNDQNRVEMAWTFIPAVILLYIAFAQVSAWANIKYESRKKAGQDGAQTGGSLQIGVSARQFEWRMRYPSVERFDKWIKNQSDPTASFDSFGKMPQVDDVYVVNELHIWQHHQVVVYLTTRDVIHSFNLPNFRVKQDALPGKLIPVFFTPTKANCAFNIHKKRYIDGMDPNLEEDRSKGEQAFTKLVAELEKTQDDLKKTEQELKKAQDELRRSKENLKEGDKLKDEQDRLQKIESLSKKRGDLEKEQDRLAKEKEVMPEEHERTIYKADSAFQWDIPCAELCGWGHYRMIGRVYVHKDHAEFRDWLEKAQANYQKRTGDR